MPRTATAPAPPPAAPAGAAARRWRPRVRHVALAAAVAAALLLVALPATRRTPAPTGPQPVARAWPGAQSAEFPGSLADGPAYEPKLFLDARVSVGTAPSPDATALRLVLRAAEGALRELRRLPMTGNPQFDGITSDGDTLAWAETVTAGDRGRTRMYVADLRTPGPPRMLTADTGDVVFFGSGHDLVIAEQRLRWAASGGDGSTALRSVALTGGPVETRTEPGSWAQAAWPWLISGGADRIGAIQVRNLADGRTTDVPMSGVESTVCGPAWCRVLVQSAGGLDRIDVMRPDGRDRRTIADGSAGAAVVDVAVLDRFEILAVAGPDDAVVTSARLQVYDIATGRTVDVADGVDDVASRGGVLWWSTGEDEATRWHSLDLRTV